MVGKPLEFRGLGLQPSYAATNGGIYITARSTPAYAEASTHAERLPTPSFQRSEVSVPSLVPSVFEARTLGV